MKHIIPLILLTAACGSANHSGNGESVPTQPVVTSSSMAVADSAALPSCDDAHNQQLVYVMADKTFQTCQSGSWNAIDIKGDKGDAGAAGKDGADNHIIASIHCGGLLESTGWSFNYDVALMSSSDVFATGSIAGDAFGVSGTAFYSSAQVGAATASVSMVNDAATPNDAGWWTIVLDRSTLVTTITYHDGDVSGGSQSWTMTADKCTKNTY